MRDLFKEIKATPLDSALALWEEKTRSLRCAEEAVNTKDSIGRVTSRPVTARISSPFYHSSAMDGYAVRFAETIGASETSPKQLALEKDAVYVDTGDPLPDGFNSVIMVEDVVLKGGAIELIEAATPWQNVRVIGEDIVATELILPENHAIRPVDIAAMIAGGHTKAWVRKKPAIAVIPTGSEIVEPEDAIGSLKKGDILEYNSRMLCGLIEEAGGTCLRMNIVPDDPELLKSAVVRASEDADIVIINAGASAGSEDFTSRTISEAGEVFVHGLNIKPGKPLILGALRRGEVRVPALGIPGYPVSAYITFELFAKPLIYKMLGLNPPERETIKATLSRQTASPLGQEEFIRVKLGKVGEKLIATPLGRGAGLLMTLVRADGLLRIPAMSEGRAQGAEVDVTLLRHRRDIENTIVSIGSHDNSLDVLANILKKRHPELSLSSAHVGSMGGLVALKMSEAHVAPTHLLDEETGQYNVPFIERLLPGRKVVLINLVHRVQGLMVRKGNPKGIKSISDLARKDVTFVNRQRGAGTRLLLDTHLKESGIDSGGIIGYEREEYTHMAVASAVLTGVADTGMGVLSAANALGLDFLPIALERYDLAFAGEFVDTPMVRTLIEIIRNDAEFKEAVLAMGGYEVSDMGKVMWENG